MNDERRCNDRRNTTDCEDMVKVKSTQKVLMWGIGIGVIIFLGLVTLALESTSTLAAKHDKDFQTLTKEYRDWSEKMENKMDSKFYNISARLESNAVSHAELKAASSELSDDLKEIKSNIIWVQEFMIKKGDK